MSHMSRLALTLIAVLTLAACAAPGARSPDQQEAGTPRRTKAVTIGVTSGVQAMGIMGAPTTAGGWHSVNEVHSNGLITSEATSRKPIGQLAERVPSLGDGTVSILPDGRMRVVYQLRRGVTWQDGAPFTARDLEFSFRLNSDPGIPSIQRDVINRIQSVEAPDDTTFVLYFQTPYYLGATLGLRPFWPQPQHLLGTAYDRYQATGNADEIINLPYWTSEYVHLGPFRLTNFDPGEGMDFQGYEGYFLGRPKLDVVRVRTFSDQNTLFSNLLAGTVDIIPDIALNSELGFQLMERWERSGDGKVHVKRGITWFLAPQWRPQVQGEPTVLDVRVRAALYHALDREALSDGLQSGHPELAAWSLLPPGHEFYEPTKDGFRPYAYNPDRARALLQEVGWTHGPDGILRHSSDGRRFRQSLWTTPGRDREISAFADYWRRIGAEVEEQTVPAAQVRNLEYRAQYPNWESSAQGGGDAILGRLGDPTGPARPETRWVGERGGYDDPRARELVLRYRSSLSPSDQSQAMKAISDFVAAELPILVLYYLPDHVGVRKGVKAFNDIEGGAEAAQPYGTYSRNSHLWDLS